MMQFTSMDVLLPDILSHVKGCSNFTIRDNLRYVALDFCRKTLFSQDSICDVDIEADNPEVIIPCPSSNVERINTLFVLSAQRGFLTEYNARTLGERSSMGEHRSSNPFDNAKTEWPGVWFTHGKSSIMLSPTPSVSHPSELTVRNAYQPTSHALSLDSRLIDDHRQALINGTLSKLLAMPGEEWSNKGSAKSFEENYLLEISHTRVEVNRDFGLTPQQVQMRPFA